MRMILTDELNKTQVYEWIAITIGEKKQDEELFLEWIKDGRILCHLANALSSGDTKKLKVRSKENHKTFHSIESISSFLRWCQDHERMLPADLFTCAELLELKNEKTIVRCMDMLHKKYADPPVKPSSDATTTSDSETSTMNVPVPDEKETVTEPPVLFNSKLQQFLKSQNDEPTTSRVSDETVRTTPSSASSTSSYQDQDENQNSTNIIIPASAPVFLQLVDSKVNSPFEEHQEPNSDDNDNDDRGVINREDTTLEEIEAVSNAMASNAFRESTDDAQYDSRDTFAYRDTLSPTTTVKTKVELGNLLYSPSLQPRKGSVASDFMDLIDDGPTVEDEAEEKIANISSVTPRSKLSIFLGTDDTRASNDATIVDFGEVGTPETLDFGENGEMVNLSTPKTADLEENVAMEDTVSQEDEEVEPRMSKTALNLEEVQHMLEDQNKNDSVIGNKVPEERTIEEDQNSNTRLSLPKQQMNSAQHARSLTNDVSTPPEDLETKSSQSSLISSDAPLIPAKTNLNINLDENPETVLSVVLSPTQGPDFRASPHHLLTSPTFSSTSSQKRQDVVPTLPSSSVSSVPENTNQNSMSSLMNDGRSSSTGVPVPGGGKRYDDDDFISSLHYDSFVHHSVPDQVLSPLVSHGRQGTFRESPPSSILSRPSCLSTSSVFIEADEWDLDHDHQVRTRHAVSVLNTAGDSSSTLDELESSKDHPPLVSIENSANATLVELQRKVACCTVDIKELEQELDESRVERTKDRELIVELEKQVAEGEEALDRALEREQAARYSAQLAVMKRNVAERHLGQHEALVAQLQNECVTEEEKFETLVDIRAQELLAAREIQLRQELGEQALEAKQDSSS